MSYSAIGQIVDTNDIEELVSYLKELSYGHLLNVKKALEGEYQRVETTKEALATLIMNPKTRKKEKNKAKKLMEQLYISLQRIEDRATIVEELLKDNAIKH